MFKVDWEKTSVTYLLPEGMVEHMVQLAYPNTKLISHESIAGGCAFDNIALSKLLLIERIYDALL